MKEVKAYRKKTGSKNWMGLMIKEAELWIERVILAFKSRNVISVPFKSPLKVSDDFFCFTIPGSQTEKFSFFGWWQLSHFNSIFLLEYCQQICINCFSQCHGAATKTIDLSPLHLPATWNLCQLGKPRFSCHFPKSI